MPQICSLSFDVKGKSGHDLRAHVSEHFARLANGKLTSDERAATGEPIFDWAACAWCGSKACKMILVGSPGAKGFKAQVNGDCFGFQNIHMGFYYSANGTPKWKGNIPVKCPCCETVVARFALAAHYTAMGHEGTVPADLAVAAEELSTVLKNAVQRAKPFAGVARDRPAAAAAAAGAGAPLGAHPPGSLQEFEPAYPAAKFCVSDRVTKNAGAYGPATIMELRPGTDHKGVFTTLYKLVYDELDEEGVGQARYEYLAESDISRLLPAMDPKASAQDSAKVLRGKFRPRLDYALLAGGGTGEAAKRRSTAEAAGSNKRPRT